MLRFVFLVLALVASVSSAIADNSAEAAYSCRRLLESALLGHAHDARWIETCNANEYCGATRRFIEQRHRPGIPGLTCSGASRTASEREAASVFNPLFENACALATAGILTGVVVGNHQENIALCNQHPDKRSCESTMIFIKQNHDGNAGGLTCQ